MNIRTALGMLIAFSLLAALPGSHIEARAKGAAVFNPEKLAFQQITSGLTQPVFVTNAGDGSGRLFIVERGGRIRIFENGALLSTPFLDIDSIVNSSSSEQGLLALAFHPDYETNGQFYTVHTNSNGSLVLSRFTVSTDPDLADPDSRITLLTISHPSYQNHNGGTLAFGPDGYLYWSTGDGGGGGDPSNNAQNRGSLLGKILRLDVDSASPYAVPPSNPYYNDPDPAIKKEIWAYGLRNPWRFSFDRLTGDVFIGDVGQGSREEIDFQPASSAGGENYGWRVMEGSLCYNPSSGCNKSGKVLPVAEYSHSVGCSVTGGYVYRGLQYPEMQGYYFYGDFCTGVLFTLHNDPTEGWVAEQVADTSYFISSFGEDEDGELYLADYSGGRIYQIQIHLDVLPPGDVTNFTASTGPLEGTVTLNWIAPADDSGDDASGAVTSYLVKYSLNPILSEDDFTNAAAASGLPIPAQPASPQAMNVSGLQFATLYYFAIRARDEDQNQSVNFVTASASTKFPPMPAPILRDPRANAITNDPTPEFNWSSIAYADHYEIVIATDNTFSNVVDAQNVNSIPYIPVTPLNDGKYYWRVRAFNASNDPSKWSAPRAFSIDTTPPPIPSATSPMNGASIRGTPTFRWTKTGTAVLYQFEYDNDSDFSSPIYTITHRLNSRRPPAMQPGVYYWHVRARDSVGNWSNWSAMYTIEILPK